MVEETEMARAAVKPVVKKSAVKEELVLALGALLVKLDKQYGESHAHNFQVELDALAAAIEKL